MAEKENGTRNEDKQRRAMRTYLIKSTWLEVELDFPFYHLNRECGEGGGEWGDKEL